MEDFPHTLGKKLASRVGQQKRTLIARLRGYFLGGILVTAPISITLYVTYAFLSFIDRTVLELLPDGSRLENVMPGIGVVLAGVFFVLVGWLTRNVIGRLIVRLSDFVMERMPVVRIIYGALKQIFETIMPGQSSAFREVVVFEYPTPGLWAVGFVTGTANASIQAVAGGKAGDEIVHVFRPGTPNPATGFVVLIPRSRLRPAGMSVEEAIKLVVSGGIIAPMERLEDRAVGQNGGTLK